MSASKKELNEKIAAHLVETQRLFLELVQVNEQDDDEWRKKLDDIHQWLSEDRASKRKRDGGDDGEDDGSEDSIIRPPRLRQKTRGSETGSVTEPGLFSGRPGTLESALGRTGQHTRDGAQAFDSKAPGTRAISKMRGGLKAAESLDCDMPMEDAAPATGRGRLRHLSSTQGSRNRTPTGQDNWDEQSQGISPQELRRRSPSSKKLFEDLDVLDVLDEQMRGQGASPSRQTGSQSSRRRTESLSNQAVLNAANGRVRRHSEASRDASFSSRVSSVPPRRSSRVNHAASINESIIENGEDSDQNKEQPSVKTKGPRPLWNGKTILKSNVKPAPFVFIDFCNAVLQCLAVLLNPADLRQKLGKDHVGQSWKEMLGKGKKESVWIDRTGYSNVVDQLIAHGEPNQSQSYSPVAEFLDILQWLKNGSDKETRAYRLLRLLAIRAGDRTDAAGQTVGNKYDGVQAEDAAGWLKDLLDCLAVGKGWKSPIECTTPNEIKALFGISQLYFFACSSCEGDPASRRPGWFLKLDSEDKQGNCTIKELTDRLQEVPKKVKLKCSLCKLLVSADGEWKSLYEPPKIVTIQLDRFPDRTSKHGYHVDFGTSFTLPGYDDVGDDGGEPRGNYDIHFAIGDQPSTDIAAPFYKLRAVVKHKGESIADEKNGKFIAFTEWPQGNSTQWWRCEDEKVTKGTLKDAIGKKDETNEVPYLLFFERQERTPAAAPGGKMASLGE